MAPPSFNKQAIATDSEHPAPVCNQPYDDWCPPCARTCGKVRQTLLQEGFPQNSGHDASLVEDCELHVEKCDPLGIAALNVRRLPPMKCRTWFEGNVQTSVDVTPIARQVSRKVMFQYVLLSSSSSSCASVTCTPCQVACHCMPNGTGPNPELILCLFLSVTW